jgi:hypothetical protein
MMVVVIVRSSRCSLMAYRMCMNMMVLGSSMKSRALGRHALWDLFITLRGGCGGEVCASCTIGCGVESESTIVGVWRRKATQNVCRRPLWK